MTYCDNLGILGTSRTQVDGALDVVVAALRAHGLMVHEIEPAAPAATVLGYEIDGRRWEVRPKRERAQRLIATLHHLAARPKVSGREIEVVLGHLVHALPLPRELLCIPRAMYDFVRASYSTRARVWRSVARECDMLAWLMPLCVARLSRRWSLVERRGVGVGRFSPGLGSSREERRRRSRCTTRSCPRAQPLPMSRGVAVRPTQRPRPGPPPGRRAEARPVWRPHNGAPLALAPLAARRLRA